MEMHEATCRHDCRRPILCAAWNGARATESTFVVRRYITSHCKRRLYCTFNSENRYAMAGFIGGALRRNNCMSQEQHALRCLLGVSITSDGRLRKHMIDDVGGTMF